MIRRQRNARPGSAGDKQRPAAGRQGVAPAPEAPAHATPSPRGPGQRVHMKGTRTASGPAPSVRSLNDYLNENKRNGRTHGALHDEWTVQSKLSDFDVLSELGRGAYGVVSKVRYRRDGRLYVLKQVNVASLNSKEQTEAVSEVILLRKVRHPNIVKYYDSFIDGKSLYIVMEYAEGGSLQEWVTRTRSAKKYLEEREVWRVYWEISQAVSYLHSMKITHRDLTSVNVLLGDHKRVMICDLGVSRISKGEDMLMKTRVGTPLFLSPEVVMRRPYCAKVDVWAMGCLIYTLLALRAPFMGHNLIDLAQAITKKSPQRLPDMYSKELRYTVGQMLRKDPARRPNINEVLGFVPQRISEFYAQFPRAIEIPKSVWEATKKSPEGSAGASSTVSRASSTPMSMPSEPTLHDQESAEVAQHDSCPTGGPSPVPESHENSAASSPVPSNSAPSPLPGALEDSEVQPPSEREAVGPKGGVDERLAASRARPSSAGPRIGDRGNRSRAGPVGTTVPWEKRPSTKSSGLQRPGSAGSRSLAKRHQQQQQHPQPRKEQPQPQQQQQKQQQQQAPQEEPWPNRLQKPVRWQGPQVPSSPSRPKAVTATSSPPSSPMMSATQVAAVAAKPQTVLLEHPSQELTEEASRPTARTTAVQTSLVAVGSGSFTLVVNQPSTANGADASTIEASASSLQAPLAVSALTPCRETRPMAQIREAESIPTLALAPAPSPRVRPSSAHPTSRAQALAAAKQRQAHAAAAYSNPNANAARLVRPQSAGFRRPGSAGTGRSNGASSSIAVRAGFAQGPRAAWSPQQLGGSAESESRGRTGSCGGSGGLRASLGQASSLLGTLLPMPLVLAVICLGCNAAPVLFRSVPCSSAQHLAAASNSS